MRFGTFLASVLAFFFIVGVLDLLTDWVTVASLRLNSDVGLISHIYLVLVVILGVARAATLIVEQRRGILPIERAQPRLPLDLMGTFGPAGTAVFEAFTAYTLFTTGFAVAIVDSSGRLSAASPAIPVEGLTFIFLVSTAMVAGALWFTSRLLQSILDSPVLSMQTKQAIGIVTPNTGNPAARPPAGSPPPR